MRLVTYHDPGHGRQVGLLEQDRVYNLTAVEPDRFASVEGLLAAAWAAGELPLGAVEAAAGAARAAGPAYDYAVLDRPPDPAVPHLLAPLVPVEVWAAGVTYERSRDAREAETAVPNVYDRVYAAERPELFFKATGARLVGPNGPVGLRSDSRWQVPEPELGLVVDGAGRIVGLTGGNDMSCRDIEGDNPLYLPQAKIFKYACALGPAVWLVETVPRALRIACRILREGGEVFAGETTTARLRRGYAELVSFLARDNWVFTPTVLLTGTGIVPPDEFSLAPGDVVEIDVEGVGVLRNTAVALRGAD